MLPHQRYFITGLYLCSQSPAVQTLLKCGYELWLALNTSKSRQVCPFAFGTHLLWPRALLASLKLEPKIKISDFTWIGQSSVKSGRNPVVTMCVGVGVGVGVSGWCVLGVRGEGRKDGEGRMDWLMFDILLTSCPTALCILHHVQYDLKKSRWNPEMSCISSTTFNYLLPLTPYVGC